MFARRISQIRSTLDEPYLEPRQELQRILGMACQPFTNDRPEMDLHRQQYGRRNNHDIIIAAPIKLSRSIHQICAATHGATTISSGKPTIA